MIVSASETICVHGIADCIIPSSDMTNVHDIIADGGAIVSASELHYTNEERGRPPFIPINIIVLLDVTLTRALATFYQTQGHEVD